MLPNFREGVWYKLLFITQKGNSQWWVMETFAKYVGNDSRRGEDILLFSYRPLAGITDFRRDQILEAYAQPHTTQPKLPFNRYRTEAPTKET